MTRRFPFFSQLSGSWLPYALSAAAGILVYSGAAAAVAWRHAPPGMEQGRWALLAALAAPVWFAGGVAVACFVDAVSRRLFKRDGLGFGSFIVLVGTLFFNASGGFIGRLMGIALGTLFGLSLAACAVLLPLFYVEQRLKRRAGRPEEP